MIENVLEDNSSNSWEAFFAEKNITGQVITNRVEKNQNYYSLKICENLMELIISNSQRKEQIQYYPNDSELVIDNEKVLMASFPSQFLRFSNKIQSIINDIKNKKAEIYNFKI
jgi:hypothetical protein